MVTSSKRIIPCKIGDTVYAIKPVGGIPKIAMGRVVEMFFVGEEMLLCIVACRVRGEWGKNIFATREAAEKALNEIKGE